MSAGRAESAFMPVVLEVLAELQKVGPVRVQRVAREPPLELQVGEEVEHEPLEALIGLTRSARIAARWSDRRHGAEIRAG